MDKNLYSWDNISGEQYFEILDILDSDLDDITKQAELVAIIEGVSADEILDLPLDKAGEKFNKLIFLNKFELISKYNPNHIVIGDQKYDILPILKMNVSQYVDYQSYITLPFRDGYDKLLSVFVVPSGREYNKGYDLLDVQKTIRENLSWRQIQSLLNFTLRGCIKFLQHSQKYLQRRAKKMTPEERDKMITLIKNLSDSISTLGCC